jgi:hypothetical protein
MYEGKIPVVPLKISDIRVEFVFGRLDIAWTSDHSI